MILGFHEYWDKKKTQPTYFADKILKCVHPNLVPNIRTGESSRTVLLKCDPKLHTLRVDQFDRWKSGMSIQMVYRGPKYSIKEHFNKGIPELEKCVSTQPIRIKYYGIKRKSSVHISIDGNIFYWGDISVEGIFSPSGTDTLKLQYANNIETLAANDGFDSVEDFFAYFNKDCVLKILHWTDLRY